MEVRWMIRRDMPRVLEIERACFDDPWSAEDFKRVLSQKTGIGMVSASRCGLGQPRGFVVYEFHPTRFHILNLAVDPASQRQGVGASLVTQLARKLAPDRRRRILVEVRETNLAAQLFFRAAGFVCVKQMRDYYEGVDEDGYLFELRYGAHLFGREAPSA